MRTSENITKIAPALLEAQKAITFAAKDAQNQHFKSRYADLSSVIEAVKPALSSNSISFLQSGSPSDDGKLHLTTRLLHESGEWIEDTLVMPLSKQDPQGFGSAMTYARRYALAAITGLYQDDDDGNAASGKGSPSTKAPKFDDLEDKSLVGIDMTDTHTAMREADTLEDLQRIFGDAWGNPDVTEIQRVDLKKVYEQQKKRLEK